MESRAATVTNAGLRAGIAERLWNASRAEFSLRGYHGARVQGIARRAGCNVALLYRHWSSKKALYLDVLRAAWQRMSREVFSIMEEQRGAPAVIGAYLDANLRDPVGAQIMIREFLDGGPFLSQLAAEDPSLMDPMKHAAQVLAMHNSTGEGLRPELDATLTVLSIGGLAALVAAAHEAARPFLDAPLRAEVWRTNVYEMLLHGVLASASSRGS
ncbi:MAG TPA: helix-turn-helix domain-containing protein [Anaeromyxobacteraceae bacterium]|nr:helix-turn-helix domain-containing protein [Anaeromyxobacteraceae bacterium]